MKLSEKQKTKIEIMLRYRHDGQKGLTMNAKICDRCGKIFVDNDKTKGKITILGISLIIDGCFAESKIDLCSSCVADFYKFIKIEDKKGGVIENGKRRI